MTQKKLNKYELLARLQSEISKITDNYGNLQHNLVIVTYCNDCATEYASEKGTYYYYNEGLDYITAEYDNEYIDYALDIVIGTDNTLYLICIGTD